MACLFINSLFGSFWYTKLFTGDFQAHANFTRHVCIVSCYVQAYNICHKLHVDQVLQHLYYNTILLELLNHIKLRIKNSLFLRNS